jgi:hypothetical protein
VGDGEMFGVVVEIFVGGEDRGVQSGGDGAEEEVSIAALDTVSTTGIGVCCGELVVFGFGLSIFNSREIVAELLESGLFADASEKFLTDGTYNERFVVFEEFGKASSDVVASKITPKSF